MKTGRLPVPVSRQDAVSKCANLIFCGRASSPAGLPLNYAACVTRVDTFVPAARIQTPVIALGGM